MKRKVKFEFVTKSWGTRYPCHVCEGCTEKFAVRCEVKRGEDRGMRICPECLRAGKDKVNDRLRANAAELEARAASLPAKLEARAAHLRSLVGRLEMPSYEALEKAQKKADEEYVRELYPEYANQGGEKGQTDGGSQTDDSPF